MFCNLCCERATRPRIEVILHLDRPAHRRSKGVVCYQCICAFCDAFNMAMDLGLLPEAVDMTEEQQYEFILHHMANELLNADAGAN